MAEALIKLRKQYNLPVIDIYDKKESNSTTIQSGITREGASGVIEL